MPTDSLAIDLQHVAKIYRGRVHALRGIEMRVHRGEIFGLLGPNGAGKSTLVKIITTIVRPTQAQGTILNQPIGHKPTLARIGYLPENHRFPRYLTGRQTLEFFAALSGLDRRARKRRASELLDVVGMTPDANRKISTYSKGMAQRIGLAQAMAHDPDLILLDEPSDGVDPLGRRDIRNVLSLLRDQGKTVFINSHMLSELEMICTRVAILVQGQVARQGTVDELGAARQRYEIELAGSAIHPETLFKILGAAIEKIVPRIPPPNSTAPPLPPFVRGTLPGGIWLEADGWTLRLGTSDPVAVQSTLDALRQAALVIRRIEPIRPSLEDLFIEAINLPPANAAAPAHKVHEEVRA